MLYILKSEIGTFNDTLYQKPINKDFEAKYIFAMNFKTHISLRLDQNRFYGVPIRIAGLIYNTFH